MDFIDLKTQQKRIRTELEQGILKVLDHGQYIMGPEVGELEAQLAEYTGVKHAIGSASGTDALLIALMALGVGQGDEVITTPFTFFASCEVISFLGAKPVFVDIEEESYNIDPAKIEAAITNKTKAIIPVSLYGQMPDLDKINEIAAKYNLPVIEDGAQSFGAELNGKKSCSLTTIGCTSFFPSKPLGGYGDSGACFTNDDELASKIRSILTHGQTKRYTHTMIGLNARIDSIQAAILIEKLKIFPDEVKLRSEIGAKYTEKLKDHCITPKALNGRTHVYAQYSIQVPNRDQIQVVLKEKGIPTAIHYPVPCHLQPVYKDLGYKEGDFQISEKVAKGIMSLPMHPYLDDQTMSEIVEKVIGSLGKIN